jgi:ubiquinone/menaquinone biosynthesis C-methylase UbiE
MNRKAMSTPTLPILLCLFAMLPLVPAPLAAQEESVKPGINDKFAANPEVPEWTERFESEGREVYNNRDKIVAACLIKSGDAVADIGAGTGLFTRLFAPLVGKQGKVYAVDIAETFVKHTEMSCHVRGWKHVEGIVCEQDNVNLPDSSIDIAFVCATYHHFEFPFNSLHSILRALKPGGQLVIVDFERIEGTSSDWILGHVRAGKETVIAEIKKSGFEFVEEIPDLFEENYLLRFKKPA